MLLLEEQFIFIIITQNLKIISPIYVCRDISPILYKSDNLSYKFDIILLFTSSPFMHHVKPKRNSQFTPRKRGLSCHHAMHHFHAITSIICLFHESRPEKRANQAITQTAGGASYKK